MGLVDRHGAPTGEPDGLAADPGEERARDRGQDSCAVTREAVGGDGLAVPHPGQPGERELHHLAAALAARVGDEADPAGRDLGALEVRQSGSSFPGGGGLLGLARGRGTRGAPRPGAQLGDGAVAPRMVAEPKGRPRRVRSCHRTARGQAWPAPGPPAACGAASEASATRGARKRQWETLVPVSYTHLRAHETDSY